MSIFNELLPKIIEISNAYSKNFNDDLKEIFDCIDKFEEDFQNGKRKAREKALKDKNLKSLQSINEDDDEPTTKPSRKSNRSSTSKDNDTRKRSKDEVDGISSPEQDKRRKRNASVKAQSIISKQNIETEKPTTQHDNSVIIISPLEEVNVNLTQKMRRDDSVEKKQRTRKREEDKENNEPSLIQIKQEKVSLPPEPMDMDSLPLNVEVKSEPNKDDIAMPPPAFPVPKPRKALKEAKSASESSDEETGRGRRNTRNKKTDSMPPPPPVAASRATRASSRASSRKQTEDEPQPEPRPKRTRAKKKVSDATDSSQVSKQDETPDNSTVSESVPAEKARPKRSRRGQKAAEEDKQPEIKPKEERISQPNTSPILPKSKPKTKNKKADTEDKEDGVESSVVEVSSRSNIVLDETKVVSVEKNVVNVEKEVVSDMDKTVVLPNGVNNHAPVTPIHVNKMNETVVLEKCSRDTIVLNKQPAIMDATVVIEKQVKPSDNITEDDSILTDDNSDVKTPPKVTPPQPTSAVKEKVQQFEELATRVTRTKTRAMAKKEDDPVDTQTPPDKTVKPVLSVETLHKMNSMIFNGKQISSSATKPRANITTSVKSYIPMSASKITVTKKEMEDCAKREKEDARKKKEALLEAKREAQKRKREEKMLAAAMVREAAEKERLAAIQAAAREKMEKLEKADQGKIERMKEQERKKQELARKALETEERRRAEETARAARLQDEQRRAQQVREQQEREQALTKKEALKMQKEMEMRQKEYIEKQKLKQRLEAEKIHTPLKNANYPPLDPVYMSDGFQYLNSDSDSEPADIPPPPWSSSRMRKQQLYIQYQVPSSHVDRLFSVRVHSPDLREIFPLIERARLKRTSSAVWRTPPSRLPALQEW